MEWLNSMNRAMQYIEEHLAGEIDYRELAQHALCSEYHFKRMFSYMAGVPLSEYIRRRRLTLAALELKGGMKVIDAALKYGYQSADAFARAFQHMHGVTPTEARNDGQLLHAYPPMTFQITIRGGMAMHYRLEQKGAFRVVGRKHQLTLTSHGQESGEQPEITRALESVTEELQQELASLSDMEPSGVLYVNANYRESGDGQATLDFYLAAATSRACPEHLAELSIVPAVWAIFDAPGEWPDIDQLWRRIYTEWFPGSGYEHTGEPEIMADAGKGAEIWIPVKPV